VDKEENEEFEWAEEAHLECLKTQFVYRELIFPMEVSELKADRNTIELYYLLAARAFNNMSPIHDEIE
jgi:hypothetical protein